MNTRFILDPAPWRDGPVLYLRTEERDGTHSVAKPIEWKTAEPGTACEPLLALSNGRETTAALQSLMDELWKHGIRPRDIGTPGHLAATQAHLADFRAIAAKYLGVELPK